MKKEKSVDNPDKKIDDKDIGKQTLKSEKELMELKRVLGVECKKEIDISKKIIKGLLEILENKRISNINSMLDFNITLINDDFRARQKVNQYLISLKKFLFDLIY